VRIDEVLDQVGLGHAGDQLTSSYSRGMLQRLGLADALLTDPAILILDEPTVNIDPAGVAELLELIRRLASEQGVAVLLSSHLLHQVQEVCDRIGIFVSGRLVAVGPIGELAETRDNEIEVGTRGPSADEITELLAAIDGVTSVAAEDELWLVTAERDVRAEIVDALHDADLPLLHLRQRSAELDDIYRRYFQTVGHDEETDDGHQDLT
jgi:ABC-2 type transport system ATP-binding protein